MATKANHSGTCETIGHDFSRTKTVREGAFGQVSRRVRYCSFCGAEKPARTKGAVAS